mmetsp:Transcript_36621/g.67120  ORF Transcript_36621/g.67120 Transcript_36621/m.67120 type:complete len:338 (-) Transcript_36621:61-1074(-)
MQPQLLRATCVRAYSLLTRMDAELQRSLRSSLMQGRHVGTSTAEWRSRQEAISRGIALNMHRRRHPVEVPEAADGSLELYSKPNEDDAAVVAARARRAALDGDAAESFRLAWALRDLPWDAYQKEALNAFHDDEMAGQPRRSLLQACSSKGLLDAVQVVLDMKVNVQMKDADGKTALHLAAEAGHVEVVRQLLLVGRAPVNARDACGQTPMLLAALAGETETCKVLTWFGAKVDAADRQGRTPLALAPPELKEWLDRHMGQWEQAASKLGKTTYFKQLGVPLPHHVVAPQLVLTAVGYCPIDEDGKIQERRRGIRFSKRRQAPSSPSCRVNWYSPRG